MALNSTDEISLRDLVLKIQELFSFLVSRWVIIVCFGIAGALVGFIYAVSQKPLYNATTTFVLEDAKPTGSGGSFSGIANMVGINLGGGGGIFQGDNILELYKSRTMIEKTLLTEINYNKKKKLLIDYYIEFNDLKTKFNENPELRNLDFTTKDKRSQKAIRLKDSILAIVVKDINANYLKVDKPDQKLSIIEIDTQAPDEFFAKNFNEQIVKNVNDFYIQTKTKKSLDNINILQRKADSVRSAMKGFIYSGAVVTDATPNLNPNRQAQRVVPVQSSQLSVETNKTILATLIQNLELEKISLLKETPLIQIVDVPNYPLEVKKMSKKAGVLGGGLIVGFLIITIVVFEFLYKKIMSSE